MACLLVLFPILIVSNSSCTLVGLSWTECWLPNFCKEELLKQVLVDRVYAWQMCWNILSISQCMLKIYWLLFIEKNLLCTFIFKSTLVKDSCEKHKYWRTLFAQWIVFCVIICPIRHWMVIRLATQNYQFSLQMFGEAGTNVYKDPVSSIHYENEPMCNLPSIGYRFRHNVSNYTLLRLDYQKN